MVCPVMRFAVLFTTLALVSCTKEGDSDKRVVEARTGSGSGVGPVRAKTEQVAPPFDLKNPPADATKTASGLVVKKITSNDAGAAPKRNDTVMVNYTGWVQSTGETFYTNRSHGKPMPMNLATTAPGFTEGLQ